MRSCLPIITHTSLVGGSLGSQKAGLAIAQSFREAAGGAEHSCPLDGTRTLYECVRSSPASLSHPIHHWDKGCFANRHSKALGER